MYGFATVVLPSLSTTLAYPVFALAEAYILVPFSTIAPLDNAVPFEPSPLTVNVVPVPCVFVKVYDAIFALAVLPAASFTHTYHVFALLHVPPEKYGGQS